MLAFLDSDSMIFAAGFACEKKEYIVSIGDELEDSAGFMVFKGKKELNDWLKSNGLHEEELDIKVEVKLEPIENALHALDTLIDAILHSDILNIHDWEMFLTGDNNFRREMKTKPVYKGTRDPNLRPKYEFDLRQHLITKWGAKVIHGMEADDACGIAQCKCLNEGKESVIVSIDKDLNMIPGWHYNYKQKELYKVSEHEANMFFWEQMLTGDTSDNIQGLKGIGPVKAKKLLEGWQESFEYEYPHHKAPNWFLNDRVKQEYDNEFGKDSKRMFKQNKDLLWILREPREAV